MKLLLLNFSGSGILILLPLVLLTLYGLYLTNLRQTLDAISKKKQENTNLEYSLFVNTSHRKHFYIRCRDHVEPIART